MLPIKFVQASTGNKVRSCDVCDTQIKTGEPYMLMPARQKPVQARTTLFCKECYPHPKHYVNMLSRELAYSVYAYGQNPDYNQDTRLVKNTLRFVAKTATLLAQTMDRTTQAQSRYAGRIDAWAQLNEAHSQQYEDSPAWVQEAMDIADANPKPPPEAQESQPVP